MRAAYLVLKFVNTMTYNYLLSSNISQLGLCLEDPSLAKAKPISHRSY
jgi:hypothetical protein